MGNLWIGVNKLVGKLSINLLLHTNSATCTISIIIHAPTVAYTMGNSWIVKVVHLNKISVFVTTVALLCQHVIVNKQM